MASEETGKRMNDDQREERETTNRITNNLSKLKDDYKIRNKPTMRLEKKSKAMMNGGNIATFVSNLLAATTKQQQTRNDTGFVVVWWYTAAVRRLVLR